MNRFCLIPEELIELLIPEELIELKAHQIWEKRQIDGSEGTSQSDWEKAKQYLKEYWWEVLWWKFRKGFNRLEKLIEKIVRKLIEALWRLLSFPFWLLAEPLSRDFALEIFKTLGIGFTAFGLLFSVWEGLEDRKLTREKLITERFSKAVEQLGVDENITVRVGGIYALERISRESDKDFLTIMEVLTSYVREKSPLPLELKQYFKSEPEWEDRQKTLEGLEEVSIDVQAVLTVIGRRKGLKFPSKGYESIDLSFTNLQGADLFEANLEGANLAGANLQNADLKEAYLGYANLEEVNLQGVDLRWTNNLGYAYLARANLQNTNLEGVNLLQARLFEANLQKANLERASLRVAKLLNANLQDAVLSFASLRAADLWNANLQGANLFEANLEYAELRNANLQNANLKWANLEYAELRNANLQGAILMYTYNLTPKQIKSACFWEKAIYKTEWHEEKQILIAMEPDNTNYIEKLKKDTASDPEEPIDCSYWKKEN